MNSTIVYKNGDRPFRCTVAQATVLDALNGLTKGGMASVKGYRPTTNYTTPPVQDLQVITAFNYGKFMARKKKALESISYADVAEDIAKAPKLSALSSSACLDQFNSSRKAQIDSIDTTASGDRSDAHRQGHDRCYIQVADGVKVNLVTVKDNAGLEQPVLTDGLPTVASILLPVLEVKKTVREAGVYKVVNSGPKVLMDKIITKHLNIRCASMKTLSLRDGNFEAVNLSHQKITPTSLRVTDNQYKLLSLLESCGFDGEVTAVLEAMKAQGVKL